MNLLYLEKFNNYYNRKVKYFSSVDDYIDNSLDYAFNAAVDFNPGDGVVTVKTFNSNSILIAPDYLLVLEEGNENIVSRWFVIESKRERNGQYTLTLRRDVLADYYESIKSAPIFVQKGLVSVDNPLLYNSEGLGVNQIKKSETLLKDETNNCWLVGYVANNAITENVTVASIGGSITYPILEGLNINLNDPTNPTTGGKINYTSKVEFIAGAYNKWNRIGAGGYDINDIDLVTEVQNDEWGNGWYNAGIYKKTSWSAITWSYNPNGVIVPREEIIDLWSSAIINYKTQILLGLDEHLKGINRETIPEEDFTKVRELNGKIVYSTTTDKYYKLTTGAVITNSYTDFPAKSGVSYDYSLFSAMDAAASYVVTNANPEYKFVKTDPRTGSYAITYDLGSLEIFLAEVEGPNQYNVVLTPNHYQLTDAPYSMFAVKYNSNNLDLVQTIANKLTSQSVYDIQLLPYFPCRYLLNSEGEIDLTLLTAVEGKAYNKITSNNETVDYLYWAQVSQDSFSINSPIVLNTTNFLEKKVVSECDLYRLVSPNYNGVFEFNLAKNEGVDYFNVNFTYKPYAPFIHVAPNFKGLYGSDFGDARGLICNGNFSITSTASAFENYEIQNKNFQNIFNTQINTLDKNNKLSLLSKSIALPITALGAGAGIGGITGSAGLGLGTAVASTAGGIADIAIEQSMFQNNRQMQIDLFSYNLQNIAARPDSLVNVSAINIVNKYFPFVEYYSCTDVEKQMVRNKIKYEGMTLMVIGTIEEYSNTETIDGYNFFKGQLIQNNSIAEDYHLVDAIGVELEKGVYL